MASNRVLHILSPERADTPTDEPRIPAECGHFCVASPVTHAMLAEPGEHVVFCIECFNKEL